MFKYLLMEEAGDDGAGAGGAGAGADDGAGDGADDGAGDGAGAGADGGAGDNGGAGDGGAGDATPFYQSLPEDWRTQAVASLGLDEGSEDIAKRLKQLERSTDFPSFVKSAFEAQDKIRSGELANGLPENPTDDQMKDWREANGVPKEAGGYELSLDEGLVLGEADTRIMEGVYEAAHGANLPTEVMSQLTNAMLNGRIAEEQRIIAQDAIDTQTTTQQLRETWGGDAEINTNLVKSLVAGLPESIREAFQSARMPDGKAIFNTPELMVAMADWKRKIDPLGVVVPNSANAVQATQGRIKELEGMMGEPGWHKNGEAQAEYQRLVDAQTAYEAQQ